MNLKCVVLSGLLLSVAGVANAQMSTSAYVKALNKIMVKCVVDQTNASLNLLVTQLHGQTKVNASRGKDRVRIIKEERDKVENVRKSGNKEVNACVTNAKKRGATAYEKYTATAGNSKIRQDMKDVLVAWLAYLPDRVLSPKLDRMGDHSRDGALQVEQAAYNRAVSILEADELTE